MPLPTCPSGEVTRHAYTTKRGSYVKSACIPDVGAPGKTPKSKRIPILSQDLDLKSYGYQTSDRVEVRQEAIKKAIHAIANEKSITLRQAAVKVLRHLNALSILNKNTNPYISQHKFVPDREWISKTYLG